MKQPLALITAGLAGTLILGTQAVVAETPTSTKVAYQQPAGIGMNAAQDVTAQGELVFSAAPRETQEEANKIYGPVAEYMSKVLNRKVSFKYPGTWGVYQGTMQKGGYDIVFDGPHFNGWRVSKIQHNMLVKVPGDHVFVALVKNDSPIKDVKQLAGRTVCGHAPPNLGTLTLLEQFDNPSRQPVLINTDGWRNIYKGLVEGRCVAAVIPLKKLEQFEQEDGGGSKSKIVYRARTLPDNAFSVGPRISAKDQARLSQALTSSEGTAATEALRNKYAGGKAFAATSNREYAELGAFLKNEWGYYP